MTSRRLLWASMLGVVLLGSPRPGVAVIRVDLPISKMVGTSRTVMIGTVVGVSPANRVCEVKVEQTTKGEPLGDRFRVQILEPAELIKDVAAGGPLVCFVGKVKGGSLAVLHLADTWLLAKRIADASPPAWRVVGVHDAKLTFPGRTAALVRIVRELKSGKTTLLDRIEPKVFRGGVKELARLKVTAPRFCLPADCNGDGKPDLLIGTAKGTRLLLATAGGFEDVTEKWGSWGGAGGYRAFGDVNGDGKCDLLLDGDLWINTGRAFARAKGVRFETGGKVRPLAAALEDATGDGRPDALLLDATGELRVFENPASPARPWPPRPARRLWTQAPAPVAAAFGRWGDDGGLYVLAVGRDGVTRYAVDPAGGPPTGHERLTAKPLAAYHKAHGAGLRNVSATTIDVNGDRRPDLLVVADGGALLLVNRGFGAFLVNPDAGGALGPPGPRRLPFALTPTTPWAAADLHGDRFEDLLVLAPDGRLYEVDNPPFATGDEK